jgi:hypothetical protein
LIGKRVADHFLSPLLNIKNVMAELKRYNDFVTLKLAPKSNPKSDVIDIGKVKELEKFFELLRSNLLTKKHRNTPRH